MGKPSRRCWRRSSVSREHPTRFSRWVKFTCGRTRLTPRKDFGSGIGHPGSVVPGSPQPRACSLGNARVIKDLTQARPALEKSCDEVKRALSLRPDLAGAHLLKGNLLLRVSRAHDAFVEFDEYLRLEPNGPFAAETRALVEKIRKATAGAH